jgi:hypothetical protein
VSAPIDSLLMFRMKRGGRTKRCGAVQCCISDSLSVGPLFDATLRQTNLYPKRKFICSRQKSRAVTTWGTPHIVTYTRTVGMYSGTVEILYTSIHTLTLPFISRPHRYPT